MTKQDWERFNAKHIEGDMCKCGADNHLNTDPDIENNEIMRELEAAHEFEQDAY